jgi:predicted nuclease of predicted toxin-antitoxin system
MLRLASDENFNADIVRGLLRRQSNLDLVRIRDVGLLSAADPVILAWAADENRIVLSHDLATMPSYAFDRIRSGEPMPGIFLLSTSVLIGHAIDEILLLNECSDQAEWNGKVAYLPL